MGLLSTKLRSITNANGDKAVGYFCPGCKSVHVVWYQGRHAWTWNGEAEKPTFRPSYRVFSPAHATDSSFVPEETLCHCFVTDGNIQFLSDCVHELAGQTVPMPDWPYAKDTYGGIDE